MTLHNATADPMHAATADSNVATQPVARLTTVTPTYASGPSRAGADFTRLSPAMSDS